MKHIFSKTKALLMVLCIGWGIMATSCINEDLDACRTHKLTLQVLNLQGYDITEGSAEDVKDASVFIFDENGKHLETVKMTSAQIITRTPIEINYPTTKKLQIVAWGNVNNDMQQLQVGATIDDLKIQVKKSNSYAQSPAELYFGDDEVPLSMGTLTKDEEVPIQLAVGRLQMRTLNLDKGLVNNGLRSDVECQFFFKKTLDQLNSKGEVEGNDVAYDPDAEWVGSEWEMTEFDTIFPGELQLGTIEANGIQIGDADKDYETQELLRAEAGHDTIVVFVWGDNGEYLGARIKVRPWGFIDDPIEW